MWGGYPQQTWPYMTPSIWVLNTAIPLEQFSFTLLLEYYIPTFHLWFRKKISSNPPGAKFYSLQYHPDPHYSPFPTKKVPFKRASLIFGPVFWGLFEPVTITTQRIQKSKVLPVTSRRRTDLCVGNFQLYSCDILWWKPSTCGPFCWQKRKLWIKDYWLVVSTPLKNMKVSWDYCSQYMEK